MSHMTPIQTVAELSRLLETLDVGRPRFAVIEGASQTLRNAARRLKQISERECNGVIGPDGYAKWDDVDQAQADKQRESAERKAYQAIQIVMDTATFATIDIEFQGDPRGAPIVIHHKGREGRIAVFY